MTSLGNKIVFGTFWTAVETWGRQAAMFAVFVILVRHLGPEAFGLAALSLVAPVLLAVPVTKGLPEALIQRSEVEPIHFHSVFWLLVAIGAVLSGLIWAFAGVIADIFGQPVLKDLIRWTSLIVLIQSIAGVPIAILKRQLNFRLFALRTMVGTIIGGSLGVALAISGYGMWSIIWMQIAKAVVETVVLLVGSAWSPRLQFSWSRCSELFGFGGPILGQSLWTFVNDEMPKVILGLFLGPYAVGIYAMARRPLELLVEAFLSPIVAMTMPAVARVQNEPDKIDRFFNASVRLAGIVAFPAFVGFAAIAPVAVPFIFGQQWISGILAVQILMLLGLQRAIDSICAFTILALGHSGLILKLNIAYTVLGAILLTAAAQININVTISALVATNLLLLPIFLFLVQRIGQVDVLKPLAIYPRLAFAAVLMFAAVAAWLAAAPANLSPIILIAGGIAAGAVVYLGAAIILVRPDLLNARDLSLRLRG
jgi:O-antigen/teichoic acid export membrane protein